MSGGVMHDWAERIADQLAFNGRIDRLLAIIVTLQRWLLHYVLPLLFLIVVLSQLFLTRAPEGATGMAAADVHAAEMEIDP